MVSDTTLPSSVFMSNGSSKSSLQSSTSAGYSCDLIPIAGGSCASLDENSLSLDETILEQLNINTSKTTKLCLCVCTYCHNSMPRKMCVLFRVSNYDFTNLIVCEALDKDIRYIHSGMPEFMCKTFHGLLQKNTKTNVLPKMPKNAIASPYKSQSNNLTLSCTTSGQSSTMYTETLRAKVQQHTKVISTSTVPNAASSTMKGSSLLAQTSTINAISSDTTTLTCDTTVYDGNSNFQYVCTCYHNIFSRQMC